MNKVNNAKNPPSFRDASGELKVTLQNDLFFHYLVQKSKPFLKNLVCSLKGLNPEDVRDVVVTNPIDYSKYAGKQIILDVRILLNNKEILDVELQVYDDPLWEKRSLLYLCRSFDSIGSGEDYSELKPTTLITIIDRDLFPGQAEFYSRFLMTNEKKHYPYSTNLRINVLYLNRIDMATDEDRACKLDLWAKLFRSHTWEDLKSLAEKDPVIEEVAEVMYESMIQSSEQTYFEAHQRYLMDKRSTENYYAAKISSAYDEGYDKGYDKGKSELQEVIDKQAEEIEAMKKELAQMKELVTADKS